ncbi:MAG: hypothetical protein ACUVXB_10390 [Bryobacteraceae bacterium]
MTYFCTPDNGQRSLNAYWRNPMTPHGIAGSRGGVYVQNREAEVDELYLPYAVTREHVHRYLELTR